MTDGVKLKAELYKEICLSKAQINYRYQVSSKIHPIYILLTVLLQISVPYVLSKRLIERLRTNISKDQLYVGSKNNVYREGIVQKMYGSSHRRGFYVWIGRCRALLDCGFSFGVWFYSFGFVPFV